MEYFTDKEQMDIIFKCLAGWSTRSEAKQLLLEISLGKALSDWKEYFELENIH